MRVAVIGGKLQGIEALYLARKAGWETILIDKELGVPARGLCDNFFHIDVTNNSSQLSGILNRVDLIVPATENRKGLSAIYKVAKTAGVPLAYDKKAYSISSSKIKSNTLFKELGIPTPKRWPECGFPLIIKPSSSSGSRRIRKVYSIEELHQVITDQANYSLRNTVIQEFVPGPVFSIEVFGSGDHFSPGQATRIKIDNEFDCKRVIAPADLSDEQNNIFKDYSLRIAKALKLQGIMDVEAILHEKKLKVIEVDARLPSQTPTAVYHSTGANYLKILSDIFLENIPPNIPPVDHENAVIYEHIKVSSGNLDVLGEHIILDASSLTLTKNFFGADEAITDYKTGAVDWVATLIIKERDVDDLWKKQREIYKSISKGLKHTVHAVRKNSTLFSF